MLYLPVIHFQCPIYLLMKRIIILLFIVSISNISFAQSILPYEFINNSPYPDSEIYIGLVGKFGNNVDVWMDMNDYSLVPMSADQNTLDGPSWSTPSTWQYPDIFTQLSDITEKTIEIPLGLYGCRIFISFESPMYLHFHETGGYAGANLGSSSDPNNGIRWELVELTWGDSGLWTNSSRVDAYQYPISVEVNGFTGGLDEPSYAQSYASAVGGNGTPQYGKIGEKLPHEEILSRWDDAVSSEYLLAKVIQEHSIDGGYIIEQPSKVDGFPEDILDDYIDEIWETYIDNDLVINIGVLGSWIGRVTGEQFDFVDPVDSSIATIYGKPTSFNAIEGSGYLAFTEVDAQTNIEKHNEDLMIQAQIAAAITRHAIYTDVIDGSVQYLHDASTYFVDTPYNEYVSFFHNEEISYDSKTYAFAYDDVGDHSSTIQCTFPINARVIIGGYDQYVEPAPELTSISITPYILEIEQGSNLQYISQGYDQYSELFSANVTWSTTGGGTIDANGLFEATILGDFVITAQDGDVSRSINIRVIEEAPATNGCEAVSPNGDYSYIASDDTENPSITFIPLMEGNGDTLCLLYYTTDPNEEYIVSGVSPNLPQQINAIEGDTVYFYYTYSLATGGENNTSNTPHFFPVGCEVLTINSFSNTTLEDLAISPNPSNGKDVYLSGITEEVTIDVYTLNGQLLSSDLVSNRGIFKVNTLDFIPGLYLMSVSTKNGNYSKTFKLIVN